ncbi:protein of unknown function [Paraburkholderia kururiensis]
MPRTRSRQNRPGRRAHEPRADDADAACGRTVSRRHRIDATFCWRLRVRFRASVRASIHARARRRDVRAARPAVRTRRFGT